MILVDTSVWADHFRAADRHLQQLLEAGAVLGHPFVIGELALGNLRDRNETLTALGNLLEAVTASAPEVLHLIAQRELAGTGLGYVDVHLLAAAQLSLDARLWTRDKRLARAADALGLAYAGPAAGGED